MEWKAIAEGGREVSQAFFWVREEGENENESTGIKPDSKAEFKSVRESGIAR